MLARWLSRNHGGLRGGGNLGGWGSGNRFPSSVVGPAGLGKDIIVGTCPRMRDRVGIVGVLKTNQIIDNVA